MDELLRELVDAQYIRNDLDLQRGRFRVRGDTVDISLAYVDQVVRVEFWGDEVDRIVLYEQGIGDGHREEELDHINIYPATIFCTAPERIEQAMQLIKSDLAKQVAYFIEQGEELYAKRIEERVKYDLEMIQELGYCSGVENYSRYFDGRAEGTPPYCLLDYFPKDMLVVVDESHVTVPQIHAMYGGDRARKENLVRYGFRLPAAKDNRPLTFEEWEEKTSHGNIIYLSATPADYELEKSDGIVVDQVIRPTGLLDPIIDVRPTKNQVDDLMEEIQKRVEKDQRVLVTTLTKRMAEEMDEYLRRYGVRSAYIHSDVDTIERVKVMEDLRKGLYDVLVGVNLLREGLDLPEVSLVAILDADKEGFLRNYRSLTQTIGRAARHVEGYAILYGDKITDSMQRTINETNRRREKQQAYNKAHSITPTAVRKRMENSPLASLYHNAEEEKKKLEESIRISWKNAAWQSLNLKELEKAIQEKRKAMLAAAKALDFDNAALLRDEMLLMEDKAQAMRGE